MRLKISFCGVDFNQTKSPALAFQIYRLVTV